MNDHPSRRLRTLAGGAAGALVLATVAAVPLSATASAAASASPSIAAAATAGSAASVLRAAPGRRQTFRVSNTPQLRRAVRTANRLAGPARIELRRSIRLNRGVGNQGGVFDGDLEVTDDLVVAGRGNQIDAARLSRIFEVTNPDASLVLRRITLRNGRPERSGDSGGLLASVGTLRLERVKGFRGQALGDGGSGGAVFNDGGSLVLFRSVLGSNRSARAGGAIEAAGGTTVVRRSRLIGNSTGPGPGNGGALHITGDGAVEVIISRIGRNFAAGEGGGLWNSTGTMTVTGSVVANNRAAGPSADDAQGGGGLYNDGGTLTVSGTDLVDNDATGASGSGGGILNNGGSLSVTDSLVRRNSAPRAGGGIEGTTGDIDLDNVGLLTNDAGAGAPAPGNGGGLHVSGAGTVEIDDSRVQGNLASLEGGGLWNQAGTTMTVTDTDVLGNAGRGDAADDGGGGLFNNGGDLEVTGGEVSGNSATGASGSGGGILNLAGGLVVQDVVLDDNSASRAGGAIETTGGTTTVDGTDITGNRTGSAPGNGGGIHAGGAADVTMTGGSVTGNMAANEGGGVWNANGAMTLTGVTINSNMADSDADTTVDGDQAYNEEGGGTLVVNGTPVPPGSGI